MKATPVLELKAKTLIDRIKEEVIQEAIRNGNVNVIKEQNSINIQPFDNTISFDEFVRGTNV